MFKNATLFIAGAMVVMCIVMSYYLLFTDLLIDKLYGFKRNLFVGILLMYGAYRVYRIYDSIKKNKNEK
ncbi:hypothetical protein [Fluviicola chungangensis]|uniref:Uncharacterized protein n=1 Tax=Fluviicola chungangensis TaxID=2597671 RepID=A0A556MNX8_9FLAO|nr:hypothetical protein [Fluviicola chungangensis]TSJ41671.1 hypothetical protein FO442_14540 [Fluviicola chungangensis]